MLSVSGRLITFFFIILSCISNANAEMTSDQKEFRSLDEQVQSLKGEVISINRELMLLQEKLIYPSTTQMSVFVSLQANPKFSLDSIELKVDGKTVEKHIYTFRELEALHKKGVQRLYTGNIAVGKHQLAVSIIGHTSSNSAYRKSSTFPLDKAAGPKLVELKVVGNSGKPSIKLATWK